MSTVAKDTIDREALLARSAQPHNPAIAHLAATHSLPATAEYLLETLVRSRKDCDTARILAAIRAHRDGDPASPTFGCFRWYAEDPRIHDTNAPFFICTPLAVLWLSYRTNLDAAEMAELHGIFADVLPWFRRMADSPSLFYPNKCISDAGMLLATGHVLSDDRTVEAGRRFCRRYLDYYVRRGTGWGEDHSPSYTLVIVEMTLLIMALEKSGDLFDEAKRLTDAILDWVSFHDGVDAVPSIRGYNFECRIEMSYPLAGLLADASGDFGTTALAILKRATGYAFNPEPRDVPRQRRWRTFDAHFSTSFIGPHARLGSLSRFPLMPNSYMHDTWGAGWQSKPGAFIVGREEYGVLEWMTEDEDGVLRQHEATGFHDWASRHLLKRAGFHPDVVFTGHQEGPAAILLREIHNIHSPTRSIVDRWRLAHARGRVLIDGKEWDGQSVDVPSQWIVVRYDHAAVAIRPLQCRILDEPSDDANPQRRTSGRIVDLPLRIERTGRGDWLSLPLVEGHAGTITQRLLFSGWCVVLLDRVDDAAGLRVTETFHEDGEIPRPYGEWIRTVELTTPTTHLKLVRDMLTGEVARFIDGEAFRFGPRRDAEAEQGV